MISAGSHGRHLTKPRDSHWLRCAYVRCVAELSTLVPPPAEQGAARHDGAAVTAVAAHAPGRVEIADEHGSIGTMPEPVTHRVPQAVFAHAACACIARQKAYLVAVRGNGYRVCYTGHDLRRRETMNIALALERVPIADSDLPEVVGAPAPGSAVGKHDADIVATRGDIDDTL